MFSVLMSVYKNDNPVHLDIALASIFNQTVRDFELVLVADGVLTNELLNVINKWKLKFKERIIFELLDKNIGQAAALNVGLGLCRHDLVARMDADDYSETGRFKIQYDYMIKHPEIDVLGSNIAEFNEDINHSTLKKMVPLTSEEIIKNMWFRNTINHPTVMFRKKSVLSVGGYKTFAGEDEFLWAEMIVKGCRFANTKECLVRYRINDDTFNRRGGIKYFLWDYKQKEYLLRMRKINIFQFITIMVFSMLYRFIPSALRKKIYLTYYACNHKEAILK